MSPKFTPPPPLDEAPKATSKTRAPQANPYTNPGGLVGEIMDFILASSPRPVPEIALAGALAIVAGIVARNYNVNKTGLNIYTLLLAGTGRGKEAMASARAALMSSVCKTVPAATTFIFPSRIASTQALVGHLELNPVGLAIVGEFSGELLRMSGPRASEIGRELEATYLDIYGKSSNSSAYEGYVRADRTKNVKRVQAPNLSILGESSPERIDEMLTNENIASGLLPRFTFIRYEGIRVPENEAHSSTYPSPELIDRLAGLCSNVLAMQNPFRGYEVVFTEDAQALRKRFSNFCDDEINNGGSSALVELWNRASLKAMKLAALVAVGHNPYQPVISLEQMQWAIDIEHYSIISLIGKLEAGEAGDATEERRIEAIRNAIKFYIESPWHSVKGYGVDGYIHEQRIIPYQYLQRKINKIKAFKKEGYLDQSDLLKKTLKILVERGDIAEISKAVLAKDYNFSGGAFALSNPKFIA